MHETRFSGLAVVGFRGIGFLEQMVQDYYLLKNPPKKTQIIVPI